MAAIGARSFQSSQFGFQIWILKNPSHFDHFEVSEEGYLARAFEGSAICVFAEIRQESVI